MSGALTTHWTGARAAVLACGSFFRRGRKWFRYDAPDKRLFKQLQKTLTASPDWCIGTNSNAKPIWLSSAKNYSLHLQNWIVAEVGSTIPFRLVSEAHVVLSQVLPLGPDLRTGLFACLCLHLCSEGPVVLSRRHS